MAPDVSNPGGLYVPLLKINRVWVFDAVHCSSHAKGTDTPRPGRARADQADAVVAPRPFADNR